MNRSGTSPHAEAQKKLIVAAAYDIIAERGFEGLRTREVASRVGINIATLHYYFPSKEDLVRGISHRLLGEFREQGEPKHLEMTWIDRIIAELDEMYEMIGLRPSTYLVLMEMYLRAQRDPDVKRVTEETSAHWLAYLESILRLDPSRGEEQHHTDAIALRAILMGATIDLLGDYANFPLDAFRQRIRDFFSS